jgi:hypothetical protein
LIGDRSRKAKDLMLLYDDTAAAALRVADREARFRGGTRYETADVLLGLLRTADPVTRAVTAEHPQLTVEAVCGALGSLPGTAAVLEEDDSVTSGLGARPEPAGEFRRAVSSFTANWRTLVRNRELRPGPKLGTGELWLAVLEPAAASAVLLVSVGVSPEDVRPLVLAVMVPDGAPVPAWPSAVPAGRVRRLLVRLGKHEDRS